VGSHISIGTGIRIYVLRINQLTRGCYPFSHSFFVRQRHSGGNLRPLYAGISRFGGSGLSPYAMDTTKATVVDLEAGFIDWAAMTPMEYADLDRRALEELATKGTCTPFEKEYIRKDGTRVPVLVGAANFEGSPNEGVCFVLDITARKQAEDEHTKLDQHLRDQHLYTRSLIESNIDALMTTDSFAIITDVNRQIEALTGCTRDELIGAAFKSLFTDPERAEAGIKRVLREGKATNCELTVRARDGTLTVVSFNATTLYDRHRKPQGAFAVARDMTEHKKYEETLREATQKAEQANREMLLLNGLPVNSVSKVPFSNFGH
jgi:PAS domain S-box-containing protein